MALDGLFIYLVKNELEYLSNNRIEKINQPARDEIILQFKGKKMLLLSANPNSARAHLTQYIVDNPATPPMFCMLMRKHLLGARLLKIRQIGLERILYFDFEKRNEIGDTVAYTLIIELMGRYSNLILTSNNKIIDCLRRSEDITGSRILLPGVIYQPPNKREKINFITESINEIYTNCNNEKQLVADFEGLSPQTARQLLINCVEKNISLEHEFENIRQNIITNCNNYNVLIDNDNIPIKFSFFDLTQFGSDYKRKYFETACETLDYYFNEKDVQYLLKQRASDLFKILKNQSQRINNRIAQQKIELLNCNKKEFFKQCGELIYSNLYKMNNDTKIIVENYFENNTNIEIELDNRLSPQKNAENYYNKYKKLQRAEKAIIEQIEIGENDILYIDSVLEALNRAKTANEVLQIRNELEEMGYIRSKTVKFQQKPLGPIEYLLDDNFKILVGRNNKQNDMITRYSMKSDLWLHTKNIPGAHVIIIADGREITNSIIEMAAQIAAYNSKAQNSQIVAVDYTLIKNVKKPNGAKPGMVIYINQKTIYVKPEGHFDRIK